MMQMKVKNSRELKRYVSQNQFQAIAGTLGRDMWVKKHYQFWEILLSKHSLSQNKYHFNPLRVFKP